MSPDKVIDKINFYQSALVLVRAHRKELERLIEALDKHEKKYARNQNSTLYHATKKELMAQSQDHLSKVNALINMYNLGKGE